MNFADIKKQYQDHSYEDLQEIITNNVISYKNYLERVDLGYEKAAQSNVVVCSLVQNAESYISRYFSLLNRLRPHFKNFQVVLYENDSADLTLDKLNKFQYGFRLSSESYQTGFNIEDVTILSELGIKKPHFPTQDGRERANFMASLRNKYLSVVKERFSSYDYMIVIDSDIRHIEQDGIFNSFGYHELWDAICANGLDIYKNRLIGYDIWSTVLNNRVHMDSLMEPWAQYEKPFLAQSFFGGLGIYKISAIMDKEYKTICLNTRYGSEHVALHLSIDKFYMNPSMRLLRCDGPTNRFNVLELQ